MKKLIALVLATAMMVVTLSVFADVTDLSYDQTIQITGLDPLDEVKFYQVLEWKANDGAYGGWSLKTPFDAIVSDTDLNFADEKAAIAAMIGDPAGNPQVVMQLTAQIAGKLADLADANATGAVVKTATNNAGTASVSISETEMGLYMALITPADADNVYNPVFVSSDFNTNNGTQSWAVTSDTSYYHNQTINGAAKKGTVKIDKQAEKDNGTTSYDQTWKSTRIGEKVTYTVTTTIPGYGPVYQNPHFVVKDKLTDLKLDAAPTLEKPTGLTAGTDYTITGGANDTEYTIEFASAYLKTVQAPTEVKISYTATVTTDAQMNVNQETNEVWVEFSHDPTEEDDFIYKKDDTNHYTFTIDADILGGYGTGIQKSGSEIIKVGLDASGHPITDTQVHSQVVDSNYVTGPLEGATFKLYTDSACDNEYKKVDGTTFSLVSDGYGRINIKGLDAGTYYLKEDKAPNGFIKQLAPVKIEIIPVYEDQEITMYTDGNDWVYTKDTTHDKEATFTTNVLVSYSVKINGTETTKYTFKNEGKTVIEVSDTGVTEMPSSIVNTKGVELPSTGGMGTTLFYIFGGIMVLAAGVVLVARRKAEE